MLILARLRRNRIFEASREPVFTPFSSFCVTEEYWMPPSPNESVPQTLGKI